MRDVRDMEDFAKSQSVIEDLYAERRRQVDSEGWTPGHDDGHDRGELAYAAACYAGLAGLLHVGNQYTRQAVSSLWPWDGHPKHENGNARRLLVKAGALIIAEIERLDRAS
jgi:hypothetical protein